MAFEEALRCISMEPGEDLSGYQYRYVKIGTGGKAELCGAAEFARGILENAPTISGVASIGIEGESKVVAVSGVRAGDLVTSDSMGRATTVGAGKHVNGLSHEDCNKDGQIITVGLVHGYNAS